MRRLIFWGIGLGMIGCLAYFGVVYGLRYWEERNQPTWRYQSVVTGDLVLSVNATGEVKPIKRVSVGAVVSGPISELFVDFNSKVEEGQLLATIDARLYEAGVNRDRAILRTRQAEVERAEALLKQAVNDERRAKELRTAGSEFISETELDQTRFNRMAREAEVSVAQTNVEQALASLENSETNLTYTKILSPVSGVIIERKVDSGQTLAAQFQTPELFIVAPELDKRVFIFASVDEADIGLIRKAQTENRPVSFTVDAYPDELFTNGKIDQVRLASEEQQNVVTYPVIVETPNTNEKLLPGMTANLSFQIETREGVLKIPNSALRFYPDRKFVHPSDLYIIDGDVDAIEDAKETVSKMSAEEKNSTSKKRARRHVWVSEGKWLRAKPVVIGISDNRFTELVEGELKADERLVIGEQVKR